MWSCSNNILHIGHEYDLFRLYMLHFVCFRHKLQNSDVFLPDLGVQLQWRAEGFKGSCGAGVGAAPQKLPEKHQATSFEASLWHTMTPKLRSPGSWGRSLFCQWQWKSYWDPVQPCNQWASPWSVKRVSHLTSDIHLAPHQLNPVSSFISRQGDMPGEWQVKECRKRVTWNATSTPRNVLTSSGIPEMKQISWHAR